jgi:O-antigen ligase
MTESYRLARALTVAILISTFNASGLDVAGRAVWYVCVAIPFVVALGIRIRAGSSLIRRPEASDGVLLLLFVFGIAGTIYGMVFNDTVASARPIFVPMVIAFLHLAVIDQPTDDECESVLRWIIWIGAVYWVLNALIYAHVLPGARLVDDHAFRNSQLLYLPMAISAAAFLRKRVVTIVLIGLAICMFIVYPSATTVLVAVGTIVTFFVTGSRATSVRPVVTAAAILVIAVVGVLNLAADVRVSSKYFAAMGKADTTYTRVLVWHEGMARFERSPIVGSVFSGDVNASIHRTDRSSANQLPFHNDFLLFLAEGGVVGLGLLLLWIISTEMTVLRRYRQWVAFGDQTRAALLRTLLVGFNAFFVAAAFNPQFTSVSGSSAIFAVYALMMLVGTPRHRGAT